MCCADTPSLGLCVLLGGCASVMRMPCVVSVFSVTRLRMCGSRQIGTREHRSTRGANERHTHRKPVFLCNKRYLQLDSLCVLRSVYLFGYKHLLLLAREVAGKGFFVFIMTSSSGSEVEDNVTATGVQKHETTTTTRRRGEQESAKLTSAQKPSGGQRGAKGTSKFSVPKFLTDDDNPIGWAVTGIQAFAVDSVRLVRRCTKPDARGMSYVCKVARTPDFFFFQNLKKLPTRAPLVFC